MMDFQNPGCESAQNFTRAFSCVLTLSTLESDVLTQNYEYIHTSSFGSAQIY